jgi:hypothetical protein
LKNILIILINCLCQVVVAQTTISGVVTDGSAQPIPYASVGIKGLPFGTVCDAHGLFQLRASNFKDTDSLKVAALGYKSRTMPMRTARNFSHEKIVLNPMDVQLSEVVVTPGKSVLKVLGNKRYNKNVFCSFTGMEGNYKGTEAAIKADNKKNRLVWFQDFNFYILKNLFPDSLPFRLNFYTVNESGLPGENILNKPVIFKTMVREGIVHVDLTPYVISARGDFFISLECLEEKMSKEMLNFSGSVMGPAYFKVATFAEWVRTPYMGLDFNITVKYMK